MATCDDVERLAVALPEVEESTTWGNRCWKVRGKTFVWVRPFSKADLGRYADAGTTAPAGEIVAVRVADAGEKELVLGAGIAGVFTIPHFDGFDAVLLQLDEIDPDVLAEFVTDAWLAMAPPTLAREFAP